MKNIGVNKILKNMQSVMIQYKPEILTGIGIAGMFISLGLAIEATPRAMSNVEKEKNEQSRKQSVQDIKNNKKVEPKVTKLSKKDTFKVVWKCYIPTVTTAVFSAGCIIGAQSVNAKRNAVLATAYKLSERALTDYQEKTIEVVGEEKERDIRDRVAKDKIKNSEHTSDVIVTVAGNTPCIDSMGREFISDPNKIKRAENIINRDMRDEMYVSLNDFYDLIGLPPTKEGDNLGWNINDGYVDIRFDCQLNDADQPCLIITYQLAPRFDYRQS